MKSRIIELLAIIAISFAFGYCLYPVFNKCPRIENKRYYIADMPEEPISTGDSIILQSGINDTLILGFYHSSNFDK